MAAGSQFIGGRAKGCPDVAAGAESQPTRAKVGQIRANSGPGYTNLGHVWQGLTKFGPNWASVSRFWPKLVELGPALPKTCPNLTASGRTRSKFGQSWPTSGTHFPNQPETRASAFELAKVGPAAARLGRCLAEFHLPTRFSQMWPNLGENWPVAPMLALTEHLTRPHLPGDSAFERPHSHDHPLPQDICLNATEESPKPGQEATTSTCCHAGRWPD